ncbi:rhodanese-like domain-containing protein [Frisingicoccus sp.]|uniref:rhodanese-like domain-containing protein n=1 Tax=Frisingicoccus sp. TaxID=1918627 RepID=UPI0015AAE0CC
MSLDFISQKEVLNYIQQGDAAVIDIRDRELFQKGHIPGAFSMPYDSFDEKAPILRRYGTIILCCERGATSLLLGRRLSESGYRILSIGGGMEAWRGPVV